MNKIKTVVVAVALALPAFAIAQSPSNDAGVPEPAAKPAKPAFSGIEKATISGSLSFDGSEALMSPRFFRPGTPGDPCAEFSAGNFQYRTVPFTTDGSGSLTASLDTGSCGVDVYVTFHEASFNPSSICDNFVWSEGSSTNIWSNTFPVPANAPMVMVLSGVPAAPGVSCGPINYTLDGTASVTLDNPFTNVPVYVAEELIIPPARTLANASGNLDIVTDIDYAFSPGEVRYARFHCPGIEFEPGTTVTFTGDPSNLIGAVNGVGTDALYFSITAGATPVVATDQLVLDGDRTLADKDPVDCTYGLYDFPSQAQAGGPTGRVVETGGAYIRFAPSYGLVIDTQGNPVADVESNDPAYSEFEVAAPTFSEFQGNVGGFSYGTVQQLGLSAQPVTLDGEAIELVDLMDADTALVFTGDFEAAADVYFSPGVDCSINIQSADSFDDTGAVFTIGSNPAMNHYLCYQTGGVAIRASEVTVALAPVSAAPAVYAVGSRGPLDLGEITRNGTELQAPLAQIPGGWLSRLVLTNRGTQDREYEITVFGETGTTISTNNLTGTVDAESTLVIDLDTVLTGFTGGLPRATLNVTVAAPNNTIQGLYQIVNPDSGSISNHVMVRPGSN
ncbi:hypothetical protein [Arenimonas donghaensis]|uniref:Uncharacterized protein n=1 Tax=Arenimonas donghaensis DSM 18148 = HO3-R19 TaxID=1121014 RepID=A0A087MH36_9GAMM|nr:hypothetical protein [Arenimonas donghaensis]KFL36189.1 hypothetical protein N788_04690 [Arenimonas donghaensis DSM 18148 = HO3-R19]